MTLLVKSSFIGPAESLSLIHIYRKTARELAEEVAYESNRLNQYTDIAGGEEDFNPVYDADGNQTRIRTSTGIWDVSYDATDRPVVFASQDGRTTIPCGYDYQGRRFEKKITINAVTSSHSYYLYRGYSVIPQRIDLAVVPLALSLLIRSASNLILTYKKTK